MINPPIAGPDKRPTAHATQFDRYYAVYKRRRGLPNSLKTVNKNAARSNAAVKRHYPKHMKWLVDMGKLRLDNKPKRSRLKPVWLDPNYKVHRTTDDAFTMCLRDKTGAVFRMGDPGKPRDHPAFLLEHLYWWRIKGKRMTPDFMKYVLKEYGYDLKL